MSLTNQNTDLELARKRLNDPYWRINNLYSIVNKQGLKIQFKLNWAQEELYRGMWYSNLILKARQIGLSTFICLLFLDRCIFNENMSAGIIAHTMEDGQQIFRRIKFAYDNLPPELKSIIAADNDTSQMLKFSNGSSIRVGTSLRSSTVQYLHISEFGKICSQYPDKAREIMTGSLNTLGVGQYCFIESTAEGREGYFYDMCKQSQAMRDGKKQLSKLDFKFHFFPWHRDNSYRIGSVPSISVDMHEYFFKLKGLGIDLDQEQKNWYALRYLTQGDDMKREFPSTPDECWEVSNLGTYYAKAISQARIEKRISHLPYDESLLVYTAWDLGYNDSTTIIFFQVFNNQVRIIDCYENNKKGLDHYARILKEKEYAYGKHIAPFDIAVHDLSTGTSRWQMMKELGITFVRYSTKAPSIDDGIEIVRKTLPRLWIDEKNCASFIKSIENYRQEYDHKRRIYKSSPLHDDSSHWSDALRYMCVGLPLVITTNNPQDIQKRYDEAVSGVDSSMPKFFQSNNEQFPGY